MEREAPQGFDVLAIDAFSSDAIPVHLITREALSVYLRHMKPGGIIAFHVTNRYLDLAPVVQQLAAAAGLHAVLVADDGDGALGKSQRLGVALRQRGGARQGSDRRGGRARNRAPRVATVDRRFQQCRAGSQTQF